MSQNAPSELGRLFTDADLEAIRAATAEAESLTAGEVVTYVVGRSDGYEGAPWKAAALASALAATVAGTAHALGGFWGGWGVAWITLPVVAGGAAGYALAHWLPAVRRLLIPEPVLERRVALRAAAAFLEEEVFATRERTGVLIFLSLFERRVVVQADEGIRRRVEADEWSSIAAEVSDGIRAGRPAAALVEAVRRCGRLLAASGVERRVDDVDELADGLRMRDE